MVKKMPRQIRPVWRRVLSGGKRAGDLVDRSRGLTSGESSKCEKDGVSRARLKGAKSRLRGLGGKSYVEGGRDDVRGRVRSQLRRDQRVKGALA